MARLGPKPKPRGVFGPGDIPPWVCRTCRGTYPIESYHKHPTGAYGYGKECKDCWKARGKAWREQRGAEYFKWQKVLKNFGLTRSEYESIFSAQGGGCGSCATADPGTKGWQIDHDHSCCPEIGRSCGACVRGILCSRCNLMLGMAKDDADVLRAGIRYLALGVCRGLERGATA